MSRPRIENPVQFLRDHGILFEVNRQVLHPLGLELRFEMNDEGRITDIVLSDNRGSADPIYFTPDAFEQGRSAYEEYLRDHGRRNMQKRRQVGMVIQTGPNLPRHIHGDDTGE